MWRSLWKVGEQGVGPVRAAPWDTCGPVSGSSEKTGMVVGGVSRGPVSTASGVLQTASAGAVPGRI